MPVPSPRNKILPARGDFADLSANVASLLDGEICYAVDQDQYYQNEGGTLISVGATKAQGILADSAVQPGDNVSDLTNDAGYITLAEVPSDAVTSVNTQTGVVVLDADDIDDTSTTHKFATAAQLSLADSSVQPGDNISTLANDSGFVDAAGASAAAPVQSVAGKTGAVTLVKADVGLGNVDNTSDANKPISTATQDALDLKADLVNGFIPTSQIPAIAITEFLGSVDSEAEMLELAGQLGDWCLRTDKAVGYVIVGADTSVIAGWEAFTVPGSAVTSINGQVGTVVLGPADIGALPTTATTDDIPEGTTNLYSQWDTVTTGINYADGDVGIGTNGFSNLGYSNTPSLGLYATNGSRLGIWGKGGRWWYLQGEVDNKLSIGCRTESNTVDSTKLTVVSNGNLGLGTEDPLQIFDVSSEDPEFSVTNKTSINQTIGEDQIFKLDVRGQKNNVYGSAGSIIFRQDSSTWSNSSANYKPTRIEFCTQTPDATDYSETPRMVINNKGYVGINTKAPQTYLQIVGEANSNSDGTVKDAETLLRLTRGGVGGQSYSSAVDFKLKRYVDEATNGKTRLDLFLLNGPENEPEVNCMSILSQGRVGLGTDSPEAPLHIYEPGGTDSVNTPTVIFSRGVSDNNFKIANIKGGSGAAGTTIGTLGFYYTNTSNFNAGLEFIRGSGSNDGYLNFKTSTTTNALFIANGGYIGISSNNPSAKLHIDGGVLGLKEDNELQLLNLRTNNGNGGLIRFHEVRYKDGTDWTSSSFKITRRIDSTDQGYIEFGPDKVTAASYDVAIGSRDSEVLRVTEDLNVGIGTISPKNFSGDCKLAVAKSGGARIGISGSARSWYVEGRTDIDALTIGARVQNNTVDNPKLNVLIGGGITFGDDTVDANALDDYEEGEWTPSWISTGDPVVVNSTGTQAKGRYTKIGNQVFVYCRMNANITTAGTGNLRISGLPFSSISDGFGRGGGSVTVAQNFDNAQQAPTALVPLQSSTTLQLTSLNGTNNMTLTTQTNVLKTGVAGANNIEFVYAYITDA